MIKLYAIGRKRNVNATANYYDDNRIVVLKGSKISSEESIFKMSKEAEINRKNKSLINNDFELKEDISFKSSSAAAQFVSGYSVNGLLYRKTKEGERLKDIIKKK